MTARGICSANLSHKNIYPDSATSNNIPCTAHGTLYSEYMYEPSAEPIIGTLLRCWRLLDQMGSPY